MNRGKGRHGRFFVGVLALELVALRDSNQRGAKDTISTRQGVSIGRNGMCVRSVSQRPSSRDRTTCVCTCSRKRIEYLTCACSILSEYTADNLDYSKTNYNRYEAMPRFWTYFTKKSKYPRRLTRERSLEFVRVLFTLFPRTDSPPGSKLSLG